MLHSPRVREGLFKRAIIQSGTLFMPWVICQDPTEGAYEIANIIGCNMTTPAEIDRCLKNASVRDLVLAQDEHKVINMRTNMLVPYRPLIHII